LAYKPELRQKIDWEKIFASPKVQLEEVRKVTGATERDGLVSGD